MVVSGRAIVLFAVMELLVGNDDDDNDQNMARMSIEAQHAAVATTVAGAVQLRMVACCCGTIPPYHYYYQLVRSRPLAVRAACSMCAATDGRTFGHFLKIMQIHNGHKLYLQILLAGTITDQGCLPMPMPMPSPSPSPLLPCTEQLFPLERPLRSVVLLVRVIQGSEPIATTRVHRNNCLCQHLAAHMIRIGLGSST